MFFTQDDYKKIQQWLTKNSVKDTEFNEANIPFNGEETITIVQGNQNKKVFLKDLIAQVFNLGISDFVNITDKYDAPNISLEEAIRLIPSRARKEGQVITFLDTEDHWHIYQFKGVLNQWNVLDTWEDLFDWEKLIINSILPDEEDLTKSPADENGNSYLSLKDRAYNPEDFSGLGRVILRKNIIEVEDPIYGKVKNNILNQDMINKTNTIYEIRYDFDLNGEEITIPEGCILDFQGGSFSNGIIVGNNTIIQAEFVKIFNKIKNNGGFICNAVYPQWFGAVANGINYCADEIQEAIDFAINGNIVSNPWDITQVKGHSLKVILPAGSYLINKPIYLTNYSHIEGEDRGVTKIVNALLDAGEAIFYCGTYDSQSNIKTSINNASIRNLSINGDNKNCIGIFSTAHYTYFENLFIQSCGLYGIYCWEMWSSYIHRCHFIYNSKNESGCAIYMDGHSMGWGANAVNITDCEFLGYDSKFTDGTDESNPTCQCFYINNGFGTKITNCSFQQFKTVFEVTSSAQSVTVENCYFEDNYYIIIGSLYGVNILNNFVTIPLLSNAIISADVIRGCNIMNNLIGHHSIKIAKPYTENSESYLYYNNRIAGNFCSGHDANVDERILAQFDSKQNYLLTTEGNAYGSAKGAEDKYIRESTIYQTLGSFLESIIWKGYAVMTVYCNKNNGVTDAPTEGWLDVTAFRISTSGALVICKSRGVTHSEVWIGKYEEGVINSWIALNTSPKGDSTLRPVLNSEKASYQYFDTTLNKPIWWTGSKWVDATGADV